MPNRKHFAHRQWPYHLIVWVLLIVPHAIYTSFLAKRNPEVYLTNIAVIDGLILASIYLHLFWLIPRFFKTGRYALYSLTLLLLVANFMYFNFLMLRYVNTVLHFENEPLFFVYGSSFFNISQYLFLSFFLFSHREKFEQEKRLDEMQLQKLGTEIKYLRAQINPHFLFNTLNNLYGLALEKSDKTPAVILGLSKMMDYMLFESPETRVPLRKDLENLENYLHLERIRQGNAAEITCDLQGEIGDQQIVPLLLLPLVENAFKHGIHQLIHGAFVRIRIEVEEDRLTLSVENNFKNPSTRPNHGIGLSNLRRQLELFYPEKHAFSVSRSDALFHTRLQLQFA